MANLKLHRIESGVYATSDRRFQIERVGSVGEWDTYTEGWVVSEYASPEAADDFIGVEVFEAETKRECVAWLNRRLEGLTI